MPERSLRELDERAGCAKGSAFRAFKRIAGEFREGTDFRVLDRERDAQAVAPLLEGNRAYRSSHSIVLVGPAMAGRILEILRSGLPPAARDG